MIAAGLAPEPSEFESDGFALGYDRAIEFLPAPADWLQFGVCVVPVAASCDDRSSGEPIDSRAGSLMDRPYIVSFLLRMRWFARPSRARARASRVGALDVRGKENHDEDPAGQREARRGQHHHFEAQVVGMPDRLAHERMLLWVGDIRRAVAGGDLRPLAFDDPARRTRYAEPRTEIPGEVPIELCAEDDSQCGDGDKARDGRDAFVNA